MGRVSQLLPPKPGEDLPQTWVLSVVLSGLRCVWVSSEEGTGAEDHMDLCACSKGATEHSIKDDGFEYGETLG